MGRKKLEITPGTKYGRLTIIKEVEPYITPLGQKKRKFNCLCECGNEKDTQLRFLRDGDTTSCGCYNREVYRNNIKHGLVNTPEYITWGSMKQRCYNPNWAGYKNWGGRGIIICDRWLNSFENFLEDMGKRPDGYSIDRIDNNGNYEPSNCRWATKKEQSNNNRRNKIIKL